MEWYANLLYLNAISILLYPPYEPYGSNTPFRLPIVGRKASRTVCVMADSTCAIGGKEPRRRAWGRPIAQHTPKRLRSPISPDCPTTVYLVGVSGPLYAIMQIRCIPFQVFRHEMRTAGNDVLPTRFIMKLESLDGFTMLMILFRLESETLFMFVSHVWLFAFTLPSYL